MPPLSITIFSLSILSRGVLPSLRLHTTLPNERSPLMYIEAVIVCVNYSDFLAHTIASAKSTFDRLIIVTDTKDRRTADICEHFHVECLKTDVFYANGASFNKGAGINAGLALLSKRDWVCHMDADIVLPPRARPILEGINLKQDCVYGIDRLMCRSFEEYATYVSKPEVQHSCDTYIQANAFPLGVRIGKLKDTGWLPIGFFQLWSPSASGITSYTEHGSADRGDMRFALQWPRDKRVLIPEIVGVHLATENVDGKMGDNWNGRTTPFFGPEKKLTFPNYAVTPFVASPVESVRLSKAPTEDRWMTPGEIYSTEFGRVNFARLPQPNFWRQPRKWWAWFRSGW